MNIVKYGMYADAVSGPQYSDDDDDGNISFYSRLQPRFGILLKYVSGFEPNDNDDVKRVA